MGLLLPACLHVMIGAAGGDARPDVIWILMDDFGYNDLGLHNARNSAEIRTPHLDALATGRSVAARKAITIHVISCLATLAEDNSK